MFEVFSDFFSSASSLVFRVFSSTFFLNFLFSDLELLLSFFVVCPPILLLKFFFSCALVRLSFPAIVDVLLLSFSYSHLLYSFWRFWFCFWHFFSVVGLGISIVPAHGTGSDAPCDVLVVRTSDSPLLSSFFSVQNFRLCMAVAPRVPLTLCLSSVLM